MRRQKAETEKIKRPTKIIPLYFNLHVNILLADQGVRGHNSRPGIRETPHVFKTSEIAGNTKELIYVSPEHFLSTPPRPLWLSHALVQFHRAAYAYKIAEYNKNYAYQKNTID